MRSCPHEAHGVVEKMSNSKFLKNRQVQIGVSAKETGQIGNNQTEKPH